MRSRVVLPEYCGNCFCRSAPPGTTLAAASTLSRDLKSTLDDDKKTDAAKKVGALIAKICLEKKIDKVVFDRNGYLYHGRVKALADAAREAGLSF